MKPYAEIYRVKKPCKPGYEGMWCLALHSESCLSFYYFDMLLEALESAVRGQLQYIKVIGDHT